jgi:hypothetical protein
MKGFLLLKFKKSSLGKGDDRQRISKMSALLGICLFRNEIRQDQEIKQIFKTISV